MKIKVSVIVPVYNVEKFIDKCLNSLVKQSLKEIEIIVVNDGTKDNSQKIIDKYVKKYPDVKESDMNPLLHFLEFGAFECRDPHPDFDTGWYLTAYPEVL